ncbi:hypothetical protein TsocGM_13010 [Tautonia sociabilis]|uniref:Glycosyltransferase RgtA/B/C/D-like domain-containing protein n=1 Tax=Tautonia sociabilis TaxID=2080755 RepID=A0A432MIZ7_9BACT|nr:hypothetical protein TsocGM_13010 [Tautonia sociabilis]
MTGRGQEAGQGGASRGPGAGAILLVAALQALALAWLLAEPLPSIEAQRADAVASGGDAADLPRLRRADFLLTADDHFARVLASLSDVDHLAQRLPIVLAALLIGGAALSLGDLTLRALGLSGRFPPLARWPIAFASGSTLLAALTLGLGKCGLLSPWPTRLWLGALLLAGAAARARDLVRSHPAGPAPQRSGAGRSAAARRPDSQKRSPWPILGLGLILSPVLLLMALGAMQPTIEFDALEYHLQGPKEYHQLGRIAFLPHNVYTSMPSAVEMLHLLGMTVLDDWWLGALVGQLLIAAFAPVSAALVASAAWRWGSGRAAWVAGLVYLTTPWVARLATFPFVEGPLCAFHAGLVVVSGLAWSGPEEDRKRLALWVLAGLLAGGAMASKYPGLVSAVVPFGLVAAASAIRERSWRIPFAFAAGVSVAVGPWLVRNVVDTGNPVYPLAFGIFGGNDWDADLDAKWWAAHGPRPTSPAALASAAIDVAGRSDWQSPLYALLVPLALLRPGSRRFSGVLLAYVAYLFATWFLMTHRLDRFWLPLLPAAAVLAGIGADWTRRPPWPVWLGTVLASGTLANLLFLTTPLCMPTDWLADLPRLRREVAEAANPPLARLDEALPPEAVPLIVGQAAVFPMNRPIRYSTVFDRELLEQVVSGRSPSEIAAELNRLGVSHIYVDWVEIARHNKPGGYGFSPVVTRALFDRLVTAGVLAPPTAIGPDHQLYRVLWPTAPEDERSP